MQLFPVPLERVPQQLKELAGERGGDAHPVTDRIGDSLVMITTAGEREPFPAFLYIYVEDADYAYDRAIAAGAISLEPPLGTPYGDRRAMVRDPSGNVYQIAHRSDQLM